MNLLRKTILGIADQPRVQSLFEKNKQAMALVDRFVAGEDLDTALQAVERLKQDDLNVSMDLLGENVTSRDVARSAVDTYVDILRRMKESGYQPNISVKLTMLGLDLGDDVARENMIPILEAAREVGGFVRIDMEGSDYTQRTMDIFGGLHDQFPEEVGIVIQAYLHRAAQDVVDMINRRARVRLVKGAYAEPASVAMQSGGDISDNYRKLMKHLLDKGKYPAIATHDPALISDTMAYVRKHTIDPTTFEFQMIYGVRRTEQVRIRKAGYNMRVYVPYGTEWYPYFTRRIAERPANALFVARQLIDRKEQ